MPPATSYNNTLIPCIDDRFCPGASYCVFENEAKNSTDGLCGCGPELGSTGALCTEYGATSIYRIVVYSFFVILYSALVIITFLDIVHLHLKKKLNISNVNTTTLIACFFGNCGGLLFHIGGILITIYPERLEMFFDRVTGYRKTTVFTMFRNVTGMIYTFFAVAAVLNISILWLQVAIASNKFKRVNPQLKAKYFSYILVLEILLLLAVIVTFALSPGFAALAAAPFILIIMAIYGYSAAAISSVVRIKLFSQNNAAAQATVRAARVGSKGRDEQIEDSLRRVHKVSVTIIVAFFIEMIFAILNSLLGYRIRRTYLAPNKLFYPTILIDISSFAQIIVFAAVLWYVHVNIHYLERTATVEEANTPTTSHGAEVADGVVVPASNRALQSEMTNDR